jgi:hypothetical protein
MSVLETPRIYFRGEIAWDPITTNNYAANYDEGTAQPIYPQAANKVRAFRNQAVKEVATIGNWNPDGTHRAGFYSTTVCGYDLGGGVATNDPFVSAGAQLKGMLVDLEPYGAFSSQLYFDSIRFGVDGGYRIAAPRNTRFTARYINFARNSFNKMIAGVASVVWQTSFAKTEGLRIDAFDSKALQALDTAMQAPGVLGLTVRFNAYRTIYYDDPALRNGSPQYATAAAALIAKLHEGGFQPNPARSLVVGVIGLWRSGEPLHEPGDRTLVPVGNAPLGSVFARFDQDRLALDLSNSIPETDAALTKQNLGTLSVVAIDPNTNVTTNLGSIPYSQYDRTAYEASTGIVTLALPAGAASGSANLDLQLRDSTGTVLLSETALRAIPEMPNRYIEEGESVTANFQVYKHGVPAAAAIPITLYTMSADGGTIVGTAQLTTSAAGVLALPVTGTTGEVVAYVPSPNGTDPAPTDGINTQVYTYMYLRTLPADAATGALPATWDNVYVHVLANWNAMAPCMDNWLMLNDPRQVKAHAALLKRLTDPANFENFLFMPVTRDMTAGERTLLYRFLDAPDNVALAAAAPHGRSFADVSRSMRGG